MVDIFHYPFPLYRLFFCPANRVWGHAALDYLQERRYIDARRTKDRVIVQIADYALEDLECKLLPDGTALLAGQGQDPLIDP